MQNTLDSVSWNAAGLHAEPEDRPTKPEDYVIIQEKYRMVRPYHFDFQCSVRQRMRDIGIVDLFCSEFPARSREYYMQAVADGRLRVEGMSDLKHDTLMQPGMRMRHFIHRHEPVVPATEIRVIAATDDYVAVWKPHGMPVHVAGQFRKNTVQAILEAYRPDLRPLLPAHRLDKPVSGILLFARSSNAAEALRARIQGRDVKKVYIARVQGAFPSHGPDGNEEIVADVPLGWDAAANTAFPVPAQPAATAEENASQQEQSNNQQQKIDDNDNQGAPKRRKTAKLNKHERKAAFEAALHEAASKPKGYSGRPAETRFRLLAVAPDGKTSIVECRPITGRTHQIRIHLSYLGHPIANDGQYGGTYPGPLPARALAHQLGVSWEDVRPVATRIGADGIAVPATVQQPPPLLHEPSVTMADALDASRFHESDEFKAPLELHDPHCLNCPFYAPKDYPTDLRPLWLHAKMYSCEDWSFEADPPDWADANWLPTDK